jgi:hypothetical protein
MHMQRFCTFLFPLMLLLLLMMMMMMMIMIDNLL